MTTSSKRSRRDDGRYLVLLESLRAARKAAGLSQSEVASRLGKDQTFVSKIELGERHLDVIEFFDLCRALGVTAEAVLPESERAQLQAQESSHG